MPGLFEEAISAGGYEWRPYGSLAIMNPDSLQFYNPLQERTYSNNPDAQDFHPYADLINASINGSGWNNNWWEAQLPNGSSAAQFMRPDGTFDPSTLQEHGNNDTAFWNGAGIAALVTGANMGAFSGLSNPTPAAGGAPAAGGTVGGTAAGGVTGGAAVPAAGGFIPGVGPGVEAGFGGANYLTGAGTGPVASGSFLSQLGSTPGVGSRRGSCPTG